MCVNPRVLPDSGEPISCRVCWQCRHARVSDWVGRAIAEQRSVPDAHVVTLTYGGDDYYAGEGLDNIQAQQLIFDDVRNWIKRVRNRVPLRYLCVGEYGERKGRSHWHILCFWPRGPVEGIVLRKRIAHFVSDARSEDPVHLWPHGVSYWDEMTTKTIRYCVKYAVKDVAFTDKSGRSQYFSLSTKPPLGYEYFQRLAGRYVEAKLSPQDLLYRFPEERNPKTGAVLEFYLSRHSAAHYLRGFIEQWVLAYGHDNWPQSDLIDEFIDASLEERRISDYDAKENWLKSEERRGLWHHAALNPKAVIPTTAIGPRVNEYLRLSRGGETHPPSTVGPLLGGKLSVKS